MSDDSAVDSSIGLKKRARRRLVGAAALALLAVIVLPIVMDSEPKPTGQEIQIRIPSQDSDSLAARVIPAHPAPTPLPKAQETPNQETPKPLPVPETPAAKAADTTVKPTMPPAANNVTETKAEAAKKAEVVRAEAVLEGKDSGQWIVQLGAYQNAANVKQLTNKIKDMGLPSYTEKFDSSQGLRTRVRAGPFKSREAADKARSRIKTIGVDGTVAQK